MRVEFKSRRASFEQTESMRSIGMISVNSLHNFCNKIHDNFVLMEDKLQVHKILCYLFKFYILLPNPQLLQSEYLAEYDQSFKQTQQLA